MLTMEDVERAFCKLLEKESMEYDPECCEGFYYWTCGVTDLLRKIREIDRQRQEELRAFTEKAEETTEEKPKGRYL